MHVNINKRKTLDYTRLESRSSVAARAVKQRGPSRQICSSVDPKLAKTLTPAPPRFQGLFEERDMQHEEAAETTPDLL